MTYLLMAWITARHGTWPTTRRGWLRYAALVGASMAAATPLILVQGEDLTVGDWVGSAGLLFGLGVSTAWCFIRPWAARAFPALPVAAPATRRRTYRRHQAGSQSRRHRAG